MTQPAPGRVTQLLSALRSPAGDTDVLRNELYSMIYPELKKVARAVMRAERSKSLLQPTALVHDAFLRLVDSKEDEWKDRAHFLGVATRVMRQVLVDYARRRRAVKRGAGWRRVELREVTKGMSDPAIEIVDLDLALARLGALSRRMAQVAECRVFGGMTHEEIAEFLSVSVRTSTNDWSVARRWLARELTSPGRI